MRLIRSDVINTIQSVLIADVIKTTWIVLITDVIRVLTFDVFLFYRFSMSDVDQKLGAGLKIDHFESDFEMIKLTNNS